MKRDLHDRKGNLLGNYGIKSAQIRGLEGNTTVTFYGNIEDVPIVVGTARLKNARAAIRKDLERTLHKHRLFNGMGDVLVVISHVIIHKEMKIESYPYTFKTNDKVPNSLKAWILMLTMRTTL